MPRRIPDFPDSFHSWNFLSSIGSGITFLSFAMLMDFFYIPKWKFQDKIRGSKVILLKDSILLKEFVGFFGTYLPSNRRLNFILFFGFLVALDDSFVFCSSSFLLKKLFIHHLSLCWGLFYHSVSFVSLEEKLVINLCSKKSLIDLRVYYKGLFHILWLNYRFFSNNRVTPSNQMHFYVWTSFSRNPKIILLEMKRKPLDDRELPLVVTWVSYYILFLLLHGSRRLYLHLSFLPRHFSLELEEHLSSSGRLFNLILLMVIHLFWHLLFCDILCDTPVSLAHLFCTTYEDEW